MYLQIFKTCVTFLHGHRENDKILGRISEKALGAFSEAGVASRGSTQKMTELSVKLNDSTN